MELSAFIKNIRLDDQKRILVSIQDFLESYLSDAENRRMIKEGLQQILGEHFVQLEIGKNVCRITVTPGTEETSMQKLEQDLKAAIEMAMSFMSNPPDQSIKN